MIKHTQNKASCQHCKKEHTITVYKGVNIGDTPELKAAVMNGSLFVWECPDCKTKNLITTDFIYHNHEQKLMIWLIPHNEDLTMLTSLLSELNDYTLRRVEKVGELIEKVHIFEAGLNDIAIELCKYVTKLELYEKNKAVSQYKDILNAKFKFYKLEGADNELYFSYPHEGEMMVIKVGFNVYEDAVRIVKRNNLAAKECCFENINDTWLSQHIQ